jgi:hypothetical protein
LCFFMRRQEIGQGRQNEFKEVIEEEDNDNDDDRNWTVLG